MRRVRYLCACVSRVDVALLCPTLCATMDERAAMLDQFQAIAVPGQVPGGYVVRDATRSITHSITHSITCLPPSRDACVPIDHPRSPSSSYVALFVATLSFALDYRFSLSLFRFLLFAAVLASCQTKCLMPVLCSRSMYATGSTSPATTSYLHATFPSAHVAQANASFALLRV